MLTLGHILEILTDYRPSGNEPAVSSVVIDSRQAQPGALFVAFAGEQLDGHDYVLDAFERGALAALVERPLQLAGGATALTNIDSRAGRPPESLTPPLCIIVDDTTAALQQLAAAWRQRFPTRITGITGSVGKTSTKELTHAVLSQHYRTLKSEGNYNNELGLPLTLLRLRPEHECAVVEMGMYARGEIALLAELARPRIGVVTNVGPVHMERLGSLEAIVAAKQELVEALPDDGVAILNRDEPLVMAMAAHTQAQVFTYGLDSNADLRADNIRSMGLDGIRFTLHYGRESLSVHVPLLGRHSVHTALRAAAVGLVEGLSWEEIVRGLQGMESQLRLVAIPGPRNSILIDDTYNSSPESAIAALNLLKDLDGRRVAVLGDMLELGAVEEASHRLVGRRARDVAQILVAVGPRGRFIGEEALAAGMKADQVYISEDPAAATTVLENIIEENDVILVKGSRGAELDRVVAALSRLD